VKECGLEAADGEALITGLVEAKTVRRKDEIDRNNQVKVGIEEIPGEHQS